MRNVRNITQSNMIEFPRSELNPDVEVRRAAVRDCAHHMEENPSAGLLGRRVLHRVLAS